MLMNDDKYFLLGKKKCNIRLILNCTSSDLNNMKISTNAKYFFTLSVRIMI